MPGRCPRSVVIVAAIIVLGRRIVDPVAPDPTRPAAAGILVASLAAERLTKRYPQRTLSPQGSSPRSPGSASCSKGTPSPWAFAPGLLLIGLGLGTMLTPSVNVVQSAFPQERQGEISGLSRSVSNLGSALGTAVAGTILVSGLTEPDRAYALAMIVLAILGVIGLVATLFLPADTAQQADRWH